MAHLCHPLVVLGEGFLHFGMLGQRLLANMLVQHALRFLYRVDLPEARCREDGAGNGHDGQQTLDAPELPPVDQPACHPRLGHIAQRHAASENGQQRQLPGGQRTVCLQRHSREVERQGEQKYGPAEVVGHHDGRHHRAASVEEKGEDKRVGHPQANDFVEHTEEKDKGIESRRHQQDGHENHGEVDARGRHEPLVEPVEGVEDDGKEWMARNLKVYLLARHEDERPHIEPRHLEVVVEDEPEASLCSVQEALAVLYEQQCVEGREDEQGCQGKPSLCLSYLENIVHCR